jgi:hypothetical protein
MSDPTKPLIIAPEAGQQTPFEKVKHWLDHVKGLEYAVRTLPKAHTFQNTPN